MKPAIAQPGDCGTKFEELSVGMSSRSSVVSFVPYRVAAARPDERELSLPKGNLRSGISPVLPCVEALLTATDNGEALHYCW
jgi:hypothetical protein